ncbi:MAG TPA: tetratricopeptide repeat-containing protein [Acidobacteriota bacterium]|nr:tetratricopeptide repeat-containing protein [Acidobacteriota bacterium]
MPGRRLFIAMPFGTREGTLDFTQPEKRVEIDFNSVWNGVLRPAISGEFDARRAKEFRQPGIVDLSYIEWLYDADVVLADLTFGNANVYYELGIRQALSMQGAVLVACKGTRLPFDVRNQRVIYYDYSHAPSLPEFHESLRCSIQAAAEDQTASPVHVFLPGLRISRTDSLESMDTVLTELRDRLSQLQSNLDSTVSSQEERRFLNQLSDATDKSNLIRLFRKIQNLQEPSIELLEQLGKRLRKYGLIDEAIRVFERGMRVAPKDGELLREIGFCYRKKGPAFFDQAERYWKAALEVDDEDVELLGMTGGLLKRRGRLREALNNYERAHELDPTNLYPLVNLGAIATALDDLDSARKWYRQLRDVCLTVVDAGEDDYWTHLCLGEASMVLQKEDSAMTSYEKAAAMGAPPEDFASAMEQLEFLMEHGLSRRLGDRVIERFGRSGQSVK